MGQAFERLQTETNGVVGLHFERVEWLKERRYFELGHTHVCLQCNQQHARLGKRVGRNIGGANDWPVVFLNPG